MGSRSYGIDPGTCSFIASQVARVVADEVEVAIVVGGGNIFRGLAAAARGMERATGDYMGMLATVMNGLALQDALREGRRPDAGHERDRDARGRRALHPPPRDAPPREGARSSSSPRARATRTSRPTRPPPSARSRSARRSSSRPRRSTASTAPTPSLDPTAQRLERLTYSDVLAQRLAVLDSTAVSLCMDNELPIVVFDMNAGDNIYRAALGEPVGTLIHGGQEA